MAQVAEIVRLDERAVRAPLVNIEAEAALLGALLFDNSLATMVVGRIAERDFAEPVHGRIFTAIVEQVAAGKAANAVLLRPKFEHDDALNDVGGAAYLARLSGDESGM